MTSEGSALVIDSKPSYGAAHVDCAGSPQSPAELRKAKLEAGKAEDEYRRQRALKALRGAMVFCFFFMICEIVGGYLAHSLAILTDAAHLLTDVGGFGLAIFSLHMSAWAACGKFTYGWHRAEVVGTLASMFTIWALVSVIVWEALNRIVTMYQCSTGEHQSYLPTSAPKHHVHGTDSSVSGFVAAWGLNESPPVAMVHGQKCEAVQAPLMVVIGVLGLLVNLACAALLTWGGHHGHSHGPHGGHGHSHGGDDHGHSHGEAEEDHGHSHGEADHGDSHGEEDHGHSHGDAEHHGHGDGGCSHDEEPKKGRKKGAALNSAFLHALGDCIQSAGVIVSALFIWIMNMRTYGVSSVPTSVYNLADPVSSIFFGVVTLFTTKALMKELFGILMEMTPPHIDAEAVTAKLKTIPTVQDVHDLHIWSITAEKASLSVHLVASNHIVTLRMAQEICESFGITHHTIQVDDIAVGTDNCCSDIH